MQQKKLEGFGMTGLRAEINLLELKQMNEMKKRIMHVLDTHKDEKISNEYLSDGELKVIHAMLHVFTKEYDETQTSAFDDFLKEQDKPAEQPQKQETKQSVSDPYHEDQTFG